MGLAGKRARYALVRSCFIRCTDGSRRWFVVSSRGLVKGQPVRFERCQPRARLGLGNAVDARARGSHSPVLRASQRTCNAGYVSKPQAQTASDSLFPSVLLACASSVYPCPCPCSPFAFMGLHPRSPFFVLRSPFPARVRIRTTHLGRALPVSQSSSQSFTLPLPRSLFPIPRSSFSPVTPRASCICGLFPRFPVPRLLFSRFPFLVSSFPCIPVSSFTVRSLPVLPRAYHSIMIESMGEYPACPLASLRLHSLVLFPFRC